MTRWGPKFSVESADDVAPEIKKERRIPLCFLCLIEKVFFSLESLITKLTWSKILSERWKLATKRLYDHFLLAWKASISWNFGSVLASSDGFSVQFGVDSVVPGSSNSFQAVRKSDLELCFCFWFLCVKFCDLDFEIFWFDWIWEIWAVGIKLRNLSESKNFAVWE